MSHRKSAANDLLQERFPKLSGGELASVPGEIHPEQTARQGLIRMQMVDMLLRVTYLTCIHAISRPRFFKPVFEK